MSFPGFILSENFPIGQVLLDISPPVSAVPYAGHLPSRAYLDARNAHLTTIKYPVLCSL